MVGQGSGGNGTQGYLTGDPVDLKGPHYVPPDSLLLTGLAFLQASFGVRLWRPFVPHTLCNQAGETTCSQLRNGGTRRRGSSRNKPQHLVESAPGLSPRYAPPNTPGTPPVTCPPTTEEAQWQMGWWAREQGFSAA